MARSASGTEHPFATLTLAEIYLDQGFVDKALATAMSVLERDPSNQRAQAMVSFLRNLTDAAANQPQSDKKAGTPSIEQGVHLYRNSRHEGIFKWKLDPEELAASSKRAGIGCRLTVRLYRVSPGARGPVRRSRDFFIDTEIGSINLGPMPPGKAYVAAIGWLSPSGAFTAAGHTSLDETAFIDKEA